MKKRRWAIIAFAVIFARTSQGHALIQGAVVADLGGFPNDHAHAVVDEQPFPDLGGGVDLDPRFPPGTLGDPAGQKFQVMPVTPVGLSMGAHRLKPGIEEKYLPPGTGSRVPVHDRVQVLFQCTKHGSIPFLSIDGTG